MNADERAYYASQSAVSDPREFAAAISRRRWRPPTTSASVVTT